MAESPVSATTHSFTGDRKVGDWYLKKLEDRLKDICVPRIPSFIETYHLTYLTIVWSALIVFALNCAREQKLWLFVVSGIILCELITDIFDGALGRYRNTGLKKWGFFMDHFLDFVFASAVLYGYTVLFLELNILYVFWSYTLVMGGLILSFLIFGATGDFVHKVGKFSITEFRLILAILNVLLVFVSRDLVVGIFPYLLLLATVAEITVTTKIASRFWHEELGKPRI